MLGIFYPFATLLDKEAGTIQDPAAAQEIQDIQGTVRVYWRSYSETPAARRASFHSVSILNSKIHFSR